MVDKQPETALVLGGTGGIGSQIVEQLLEQGVRVVATYRTQKKEDRENVTYLQVDLNDKDSVIALLEQLSRLPVRFSRIILNSGVGTETIKRQMPALPENPSIAQQFEYQSRLGEQFSRINALSPCLVYQHIIDNELFCASGTSVVVVGTVGTRRHFCGMNPFDDASKVQLCTIMASKGYDEMIRSRDIYVVFVHPGAVGNAGMFYESTLKTLSDEELTTLGEDILIIPAKEIAEEIVRVSQPHMAKVRRLAQIDLSGGLDQNFKAPF